ncbi:MAG: NACHT domain-containing protein [bacterium]|nr:NACHT domain-containing protein [bacterium]
MIFLAGASCALAQANPSGTQAPIDRQALVSEIENRAQRDVELGKAQRGLSDLNTLFGTEAHRLGVPAGELLQIYEDAYEKAKKAVPEWRRFWRQIENHGAWWIAAILFVLLIFRDVLKDTLTNLLTVLRDHVYGKLAGSRWFRRAALRHYRRAVADKYAELKIPFRPGRPLDMREVFVPLKVQGVHGTDQIDAQRAITEHARLMVTGPPGSGKSMLARHLALSLADQGLADPQQQPVPVLLELNRLNESKLSVEEELVAVFRRNEFPKADGFVRQALEQGSLVLMFDGLDEVVTAKRTSVVKKIKDLLDTYEKCRALITCRTAVYHQEFAENADRTLEIVEFSDHQIWRFLAAWERDMPEGKSIEQLLQTLHDRPKIMALARNPLLLTIIAYLYTDTKFILPHSRTEFYERSTELLLEQWKQERNEYKSNQKRLVLQHLALFNQRRGSADNEDRRSIDLKTTLAEVNRVLPQLNLEASDAQPLLDEIVERSGLLLAIDGASRYQFAHLTLQEFFAAAELRARPKELLDFYWDDPPAWRETVKLWCGLATDSTEVVRAIFELAPVTAFESLADAQKIEPELAEEIIVHFQQQLGEEVEGSDAIRRAFAAVAADSRPRGRKVFDFLVESLGGEPEVREAAADALSRTNLPRAARVLADRSGSVAQIRPALVSMGDIAVRELAQRAMGGSLDAVDDLHAIGTPQAALSLVPLLWAQGRRLSTRAAWSLAALLRSEAVESVLRECSLTEDERQANWLDWVWEPFEEPESSALPVIAGRIGYLILEEDLIQGESEETLPVDVIDSRLGLALCAARVESDLSKNAWHRGTHDRFPGETLHQLIELLEQEIPYLASATAEHPLSLLDLEEHVARIQPQKEEAVGRLVARSIPLVATGQLRRIWQRLDPLPALGFLLKAIRRPSPTIGDWRNIFRPSSFSFRESSIFSATILVITVLMLVSIAGLSRDHGSLWLRVPAGLLLAWGGFLLYKIAQQADDPDAFKISVLWPVAALRAFSIPNEFRRPSWISRLSQSLVFGVMFGSWMPVGIYYSIAGFSSYLSWVWLATIWLVALLGLHGLWRYAAQLKRRAENTLHGLLDPPTTQVGETSQLRQRGFLHKIGLRLG